MKTKRSVETFILVMLLATLFLSACSSKKAGTDDETKKEESTKEISAAKAVITKQQFAALDIQLGHIEQKNLSSVLKATGVLQVPPQNKANITSILGGTVNQILVKEGDHVERGQVLVTLINPVFVKLQEEYLDAAAQLAFAEGDYARQKELSDKNISAQKTFQQAESNYRSIRAKVSSLKNQLGLLNINATSLTPENISSTISVMSPIGGSISDIDVNIGSTLDATTHLMDVVDNTHLHLDVFVFEQDLPKIKNNQWIDFTLTNLSGKFFTARIFSIGAAFEGESKTIPIHAEITGEKSGLIEGMNVTAGINIGENLASTVLSGAIISNAGNDYIFIQIKEEPESFAFDKIQVKRGITNGSFAEITPLQPIPEKAKVVTNGAFYLMAMLTNAGEEE